MHLRTLLLLTIAGVTVAEPALWAMAASGDSYVSLTAPAIAQHQLALLVSGPSPDLLVQVSSFSRATGATVELVRIEAPLWGLFYSIGMILIVMLDDAIPRRKPARTF